MKSLNNKIATYILIPFSILLGLNSASFAQSNTEIPTKTSATTPQETVKVFYQWYTDDNSNPSIYKPKGTPLEKLVSQTLLQKLQKQYKKNLVDADYFTKTQDNLEDWASNVNVEKTTKINDKQVVLLTVLGKTKETMLKLKVTLTQENKIWKITKVSPSTRP